MSYQQDTQKTVEVKVQKYGLQNQERSDLKGIARIYATWDILDTLRLKSGEPCYVWKMGEGMDVRREAILWNTSEKIGKRNIQMSKYCQKHWGFKLGDDVYLSAAGSLDSAKAIVLRDSTASDELPEVSEDDRPHWEWYLKDYLRRAEIVFPGMVFEKVSLIGPVRQFIVETINGRPSGLGQFSETSSVKILGRADSLYKPQAMEPQAGLQVVDIAGIDQALKKLNLFLGNFGQQFKYTWPQRSCAVLLHGGHGTGKTFIIDKIIQTAWAKSVVRIEIDAKPASIREDFKKARLEQPSIVVIDELESLVSREDLASQSATRALGHELDTLSQFHSGEVLPRVVVVAATLDITAIPSSLRKRGRFRTEIAVPIPDATARKAILKSLTPPVHPDLATETLDRLGDRTHAYTAEDLVSLLEAACEIAEHKAIASAKELTKENYYLSQDDIEQALLEVRPTAMHDITLQPPRVRWDEIGGQDSVKKALRRAIEMPLLHPDRMERFGATATKGLLLYGPPGCSKTLSAQAMATESGFNFFAVKGAELLNMYVGESERAVRNIFARARAASPSIIFFDEIESIGSKREGRNNGVNVLTTLLNEMDGIEALKGVTVMAATNQPQALDLALLRPGRFDELLYIAPPDLAGREAILRLRQRASDFADDVDITELAAATDGYSGAELVAICRKACGAAMEKCETMGEEVQVHMEDLMDAVKVTKKQITASLIAGYERWAAGSHDGPSTEALPVRPKRSAEPGQIFSFNAVREDH